MSTSLGTLRRLFFDGLEMTIVRIPELVAVFFLYRSDYVAFDVLDSLSQPSVLPQIRGARYRDGVGPRTVAGAPPHLMAIT